MNFIAISRAIFGVYNSPMNVWKKTFTSSCYGRNPFAGLFDNWAEIDRQYENSFRIGSTVRVRIPQRFTIQKQGEN